MVAHAFNPDTQNQTGGSLWVWSQPGLQSELLDSQSYIKSACLENKRANRVRKGRNLFLSSPAPCFLAASGRDGCLSSLCQKVIITAGAEPSFQSQIWTLMETFPEVWLWISLVSLLGEHKTHIMLPGELFCFFQVKWQQCTPRDSAAHGSGLSRYGWRGDYANFLGLTAITPGYLRITVVAEMRQSLPQALP